MTATQRSFEVMPGSNGIGAEISGIDLGGKANDRSTRHSVIPDVIGRRRLECVTIAGNRPF